MHVLRWRYRKWWRYKEPAPGKEHDKIQKKTKKMMRIKYMNRTAGDNVTVTFRVCVIF